MRFVLNIDRPKPIAILEGSPDYHIQLLHLKNKLKDKDIISLDTETTGLNIMRDTAVFWSLSTGDDRYFLEASFLPYFTSIFNDPSKTWIGSQIKYDANILANQGIILKGSLFCTLTMDRLANSDEYHGLKEVYKREFNETMQDFSEVFYPRGKGNVPRKPHNKSMYEILMDKWYEDKQAVIDYASLDAWAAYRVYERLKETLEKMYNYYGESLWTLFVLYESPFTRVLFDMERRGCQLDTEYLQSLVPILEQKKEDIAKELARETGEAINPHSNPQVAHLLFDVLKLKSLTQTKGGASGVKKPSVAEAVLSVYSEKGIKAASLILEYRSVCKQLDTYVYGLLNGTDSNGRIHTTYNQHVTETCRVSSTDPNLQNIPKPTEDPIKLRKAFIARKGKKLADSDYDQVEMFIFADYANDPVMIRNINNGKDLHSANAELVYEESYEEIVIAKNKKSDLNEKDRYLKKIREDVKTVGFGLLYGKAALSLSVQLGIFQHVKDNNPNFNEWQIKNLARQGAQEIIDLFFERIPNAKLFINETLRKAAQQKYTETFIGRRRWMRQIMDIEDKELHQQIEKSRTGKDLCWCNICKDSREGERQAVNHIIQGTSADIITLAMIKCYYDKRLRNLDTHMILTVHDELVFETPEETVEDVLPIIKEIMEHPGIALSVPLKATPNVGNNWMEAK
jgi:DNA polymerase-1